MTTSLGRKKLGWMSECFAAVLVLLFGLLFVKTELTSEGTKFPLDIIVVFLFGIGFSYLFLRDALTHRKMQVSPTPTPIPMVRKILLVVLFAGAIWLIGRYSVRAMRGEIPWDYVALFLSAPLCFFFGYVIPNTFYMSAGLPCANPLGLHGRDEGHTGD